MPEYHEVAVELAKALTGAGLRITPDPPHTNAFRMYAPVADELVNERVLVRLETTHEAVSAYWQAAQVPGWSVVEFTVGAATCELGATEVADQLTAVVMGQP